ncbi:MAG TPA: GNAT family N-acetyltransferase [Chitinophagaceae bacterium]|nr:GNAT family N-acetyltransferase [Chitinophagaceae bacterium]
MTDIILANSREEFSEAARLFREYAKWLNIDLCFQGFDEELSKLDQMYAAPTGGLLLCRDTQSGLYVGCVGVRKIDRETAELKRMYLQDAYRGLGIGKLLLSESLALAAKLGYQRVRLDTLNHMTPAMELYRQAGFYEIPAYYHNPEPGAVYFEKTL